MYWRCEDRIDGCRNGCGLSPVSRNTLPAGHSTILYSRSLRVLRSSTNVQRLRLLYGLALAGRDRQRIKGASLSQAIHHAGHKNGRIRAATRCVLDAATSLS